MDLSSKYCAIALACSVVLVGCGGDSDSDLDAGSFTADAVPSQGTFFNDQDGLRFARDMGFNLSSVVTKAFESTSSGLSNAAANDDPTSGIYNDDTSVEQCDSGSVSSSVGTNANNELENASIVFNNCVIDGQTTSGSMSFSATMPGNSDVLVIEFAEFGSTGPQGDSFIDGGLTMSINDDLSSSVSGSELTLIADGDSTVFSDFAINTEFGSDDNTASFDGQGTITSSVDGSVEISISPAFSGPADGNPTRGVLTMVHEDGSSLTINANTGNPDTYAYTVNGDGVVTSGVGRWDDESFETPNLAGTGFSNSGF